MEPIKVVRGRDVKAVQRQVEFWLHRGYELDLTRTIQEGDEWVFHLVYQLS